MPEKKGIIKELDFLTDLLSNRVRTISGGIVFFCLLQISDPEKSLLTPNSLLIVSTIAIFALLADYTQYLLGYKLNFSMLKKMEKENLPTLAYDSKNIYYRLKQIMFYLKQVLTLCAIISLIVVIFERIF